MKRLFFISFLLIAQLSYGQLTDENRNLVFDFNDLAIVQKADSILSDSLLWNKQDDRECADDIATKKYSLFCALYKASLDVTGVYAHRRPALQMVRFTLEKYENGRVRDHRMMDWNNHPDTHFAEVKKVLSETIIAIKDQLKDAKK